MSRLEDAHPPGGVAVVGMAALFPGAEEGFDRRLFPVSRREAETMDPLHQMMLECCWNALEDAAVPPRGNSARTRLYGGVDDTGRPAGTDPDAAGQGWPRRDGDADDLSALLTGQLDVIGSVTIVQAADATGLYCAHLAARSLLKGECDLGLAVAAGASDDRMPRQVLEPDLVLAESGRCRPFDAQADGTVLGSAAAAVALKRLGDALADGDAIRAVLLGSEIVDRDSGGDVRAALSAADQTHLLRRALRSADIAAEAVDYVEAHGSGAPTEDLVEVRGLAQAYGGSGRATPLLVGSARAGLGHTASGLVSLVRTVLMLEHRRLQGPPNLARVAPEIDVVDAGLRFVTRNQAWPPSSLTGTRTAAVSSFGAGGHCAHLILRESPIPAAGRLAPDDPPEVVGERWHVLPLSAASAPALRARAQTLLQADLDLEGAEHVLITGRSHLELRATVVARGRKDADRALTIVAEGRQGGPVTRDPRLAMLFTGHYPGAARDLLALQRWPAARRVIDKIDPVLEQIVGAGLRDLAERTQGPTGQIAVQQPVQFALQCALVALWRDWNVRPAIVLGHSVGEYAAGWAAGVFDLDTGLRLVTARGALLASLRTNGAMAALVADADTVRSVVTAVGGDLEIAAVNGPRNTVVAGSPEHVEQALRRLRQAGFQGRRLDSAVAGHTSHVQPVLATFAAAVPESRLQRPRLPMVSSVTGRIEDAALATRRYWVTHLGSPVDFASGHRTLARSAVTAFLEIGGGPVLSGLVTDDVQVPDSVVTPSLRPGLDAGEQLRRSAAALHDHGLPVDLVAVTQTSRPPTLPRLPGYPFDRTRVSPATD